MEGVFVKKKKKKRISATYLNILISHADVVSIGLEILGGSHDGELNGALIAESVVGPFPDGSDFLDGGDTVVRNQNLQ